MKITIENTDKIVTLNGIPARIWEGKTDSGIRVHCFIPRIAVRRDEARIEEFEREVQETASPSPAIAAYPSRLII